LTKRERKTYTREFKREAVRLAEESSLPMAQVARQLGIHRNMLANWRKEMAKLDEKDFPDGGEGSTSEEELEKLRQEVKLLRQERDVLKKALAIISREKA
jgi:transposase